MLNLIKTKTIEELICGTLMTIVLVLLSFQVVSRYVFGANYSWVEEVSRFAFVWSVYFGFVVAAEKDRHIRVSVVVMMMPLLWQRIVLTFADAVWLVFNGIVVWYGTIYIADMFEFPMISQTTGINLVWVQLIVPLGFFLMSLRIIHAAVRRWHEISAVHDSRLEG